MNKLKNWIILQVYIKIYIPSLWFVNYGLRDYKKFTKNYSKFIFLKRKDIYKNTFLFNQDNSNVTGSYIAEIAINLIKNKNAFKNVLLDGDDKNVKTPLQKIKNLKDSKITTAGINGNFDIEWDFENDAPNKLKNEKFDLIVSQSNFEHLLNPYKHFQELSKLLNKNGKFILSTHLPGYPYHRWPIDTVRFLPDWFEEAAKRNGLKIIKKYMRIEMIIVYVFQKAD